MLIQIFPNSDCPVAWSARPVYRAGSGYVDVGLSPFGDKKIGPGRAALMPVPGLSLKL